MTQNTSKNTQWETYHSQADQGSEAKKKKKKNQMQQVNLEGVQSLAKEVSFACSIFVESVPNR